MTVFEYGTSILSIVLGLGITHLLTGLVAPLRFRPALEPCWVFTVWCFTLTLVALGGWFGLWDVLRSAEELTFPVFAFVFSQCCLLYGAARVLVPDFSSAALPDLHDHFQRVRVPLFTFLAIIFAFASLGAVFGGPRSGAETEMATGLLLTGLSVGGALWSSWRFHRALALLWPLIYLMQQLFQPAIGGP